jgi:peptidoglycan/xylan/chitin deacetylase (PgdA/CDA1 family)
MAMIQVDRLASRLVTQPLMAAGVLRSTPGIPILMYHSVSDDPEPGVAPYYRLATSPDRFREQMQWLHDRGYDTLDLAEAVRRLQTGRLADRPSVAITFDDGFRDFSTQAWPVLAELGFIATVFLPTAFISDTRRTFKGRECLIWAEVRELRAAGAVFGSHTVNHPKLHDLSWPDIRMELADSRARIEDELQVPVSSFSYPYAFPQEDDEFVRRFQASLSEVGYAACVTTMIGRAERAGDALGLKRLPVNQADDRGSFSTKLSGAYDWVGSLQLMLRRGKRRARGVRPA